MDDTYRKDNGIPEIVNIDLWNEVNEMINNKKLCAQHQDIALFSLSTKLFDEYGNAYVDSSDTSHTGKTCYYYRNTATNDLVRKDKIDNIVIDALSDVLMQDKEILEQIVDNVMIEQENALQKTTESVANAIKKQHEIDKKIENCLDFICDNGNTPGMAERIAKLKEEREELNRYINSTKKQYLTRDMVVFALEQIRDKRAPQFLYDGMVESIVLLDTKELEVTFKIMKNTFSGTKPLKVFIGNEWWAVRESNPRP